MVAPLIAAAIALGKQKLDDDNNMWKSAYNFAEQQREQKFANEQAIRAMRAARAGDSGYAQRAASMIVGAPKYEAPQSGMQQAGLQAGAALFAAQENAAKEAEARARWDSVRSALANQQVAASPPPPAAAVAAGYDNYAGPDSDELEKLWG